MNRPKNRIVGFVMTIALLLPAGALFAQVYKSVDENGNVVYSDQPPAPGAKPMEMPEISVVEAPAGAPLAPEGAATGEAAEQTLSLRDLRRMYRDFAITRPAQEEYIQGTGNAVMISWGMREPPQPGMMVIPIIDGTEMPPVNAFSITLEEVVRGEHVVSARLVDAEKRTIANADPVTFFMRQFSTNFNNPPPVPTPKG